MKENLIRISLTMPKQLIDQLDLKSSNRSFYISKLLRENLQSKNVQNYILTIKSRTKIKNLLDPARKFFINIEKLMPIIAISIEKQPLSGPKINILTLKYGSPIILIIDLNNLKDDEELISDSQEWSKLNDIYDEMGNFYKYLLEKDILIVDEIKL